MPTYKPALTQALSQAGAGSFLRYLPFLDWLPHYRRQDLVGDLMAGVIVAIVLVPQGMAYAMLAGLPPQVGLYASIMPPILYGLLGTSRTLAVGPEATGSLLVASILGQLALQGSSEYLSLALTLALMVGIIKLVMGVVRLGFLVNFLSHPVISGYTSAAGLIIIFSQVGHLMGIAFPSTHSTYEVVIYTVRHSAESNLITLSIGLGNIVILICFTRVLGALLNRWRMPASVSGPITKSGPLVVILIGTLVVWAFQLHENGNVGIFGAVPAGLPPLSVPHFDWTRLKILLPGVLAIILVGYMDSISVAKALASKRRESVDANQELVALAAANLGAAFTGGYPVSGGTSRSVVNFTAGANTGLASIITGLLIALTVSFLTSLFYFLPRAALAAIVVVASLGLIDMTTLKYVWRYSKADAASLLITFLAVMVFNIEIGIVIGALTALALYLWRTSRPHVAIVGRVEDSEHYRNVLRHDVQTCPHVLAIRVDESLYFANTKYLEDYLLRAIADHPSIKHLVLVCSGINFIDASGLVTLEKLIDGLRDAGVSLYLAEVKGPVMDQFQKVGFVEHLGTDRIFLSTRQAMQALGCE